MAEEFIPERYGVTPKYMMWRACERMHIDVRTIGMESPAFVTDLLVYSQSRLIEEARTRGTGGRGE